MAKAIKSKIVLLGTGTPNADPDRSGPSVAIVVGNSSYLVDFGPGVVRRAATAAKNGIKSLAPQNIRVVFLTHLHSDHTAGYPDLIFTPWVLGRVKPLEVHGPKGIRAMTKHILSAFSEDIRVRLEGLEPANHSGWKAVAKEMSPGIVYEDSNVKVEAFRVNHGTMDAFGYKFHAPDRIIAISGDTAPFDGLEDRYRDCNVLIHEVYSARGLKRREKNWQRYHSSVHCSTDELAKIASNVKPDLLILYHQLFNGASEADLLREIHKGYKGRTVSGKDLEVY